MSHYPSEQRLEQIDEMLEQFKKENPHLLKGSGDFEPKLNHAERCAVYLLVYLGFRNADVAAAFNINRRTVSAIVRPDSRYYKDVRREFEAVGVNVFKDRYHESALAKMKELKKPEVREEANRRYKDYNETRPEKSSGPNPRATSHAGHHVLPPSDFNEDMLQRIQSVPIEIAFVEGKWQWRTDSFTDANHERGVWHDHVVVTNGKLPPEPWKTSAQVYRDLEKWLTLSFAM